MRLRETDREGERSWLWAAMVVVVAAVNLAAGGEAIEHRWRQIAYAGDVAEGVLDALVERVRDTTGRLANEGSSPLCRTRAHVRRVSEEASSRTRVVVCKR